MFVRQKTTAGRTYLQLVESYREGKQVKQRVIATLGRLDELRQPGSSLESLAKSSSRFCDALLLLEAHAKGDAFTVGTTRLGAPIIFDRLWREVGGKDVLSEMLVRRKFGFDVERAVFLSVLHRLVDPGSDRAADKWKRDYLIDGAEDLQLHHLYRAMAWLGEELPESEQNGRTPFAPRCVKDLIEEALFKRRRDQEPRMVLVLLDTTTLYFYGNGGATLGQRGYSRDNRPELKQMVVALIVDDRGRPLCCEIWPGNTTDVKTLVPVVDRLRIRFRLEDVVIIADRGMVSQAAIDEVERRQWNFILGERLRTHAEVTRQVLSRGGKFQEVVPPRETHGDRSPLKVKDVYVEDRRYIVCLNIDQRERDRADRLAILESLKSKLCQGMKAFVGNTGYRRYLKRSGARFEIDAKAVERDERFDGKWVLRTNLDWPADLVAFCYKQLWRVEELFRSLKGLLEARPVFHKTDETIRGHVFCSFLALVLRYELQDRLVKSGLKLEWDDIIRDLDVLTDTVIDHAGNRFHLRSEPQGTTSQVFGAVGAAIPPRLASEATTRM